MSKNKIKVVITVDTDSDFYFGNNAEQYNANDKSIIGWLGLDKGMPIIADAVKEVSDKHDIAIPISWFVRCDGQIGEKYKNRAYLLEKYNDWWQNRISLGDEIQWHAHLYDFKNNSWVQETDKSNISKDLRLSSKAFISNGYEYDCLRIGESYCSNDVLGICEDLGIKYGSSSMPGRYRKDNEKTIDWLNTPNKPYYPSISDYRIEKRPNRDFLEFPLNTVKTKVSYDEYYLPRYVNLAFNKGILTEGLERFFKENRTLVSITHPFEVVKDFFVDTNKTSHPLLSFKKQSVVDNLEDILMIAKKLNHEIEFLKFSDIISTYANE
jgi:hypothetical protein